MRRTVLSLGLLVALTAPLAPAASAAAATPSTGTTTAGATAATPPTGAAADTIAWAPCAQDPTAECGTLTVPVDWAEPGGETFELALARRKATNPSARIGSLLINPGGPGGSGVRAVLGRSLGFTEELTSRFDVVGFDPRGVGLSHPIQCSLELASKAPDPLSIRSQADFDALLAHNERYRQDCRQRTGPLFDQVHTGNVVRDLDALRAALGDDKLTYYGISYGTLIGQLYAERYPDRVRALALDSNMDHSLGTAAFLETESWTAQDSFDEFVAWCGKTAACALNGQDVRAAWRDLLARADRGELVWPGMPEFRPTRMDLIGQAFGAFYGPAFKELADLMVALDTGTGTAKAILTPPAAVRADEVINDPTQVFCQDYLLPIRDYAEYRFHLRKSFSVAPDMLISAAAHPITTACLGTPSPIPNPQHALNVSGTPTLLLGNALHDPATGYPWAVNAARQIGDEARLITYEGWGHGIYGRGACPTDAIDDYLTALTVPAAGTRCAAVPPSEVSPLRSRPQPGPIPGLPGWSYAPPA